MNLETQTAAEQLPEPVLLAFAPLHRLGMGVAGGVVVGGGLFLMTVALLLRGGFPIGPTLNLLGHFFPGFSVTWPGSLIGLGWGFFAGFLLGYGFALAHNIAVWLWLVVVKSRAEMDQYGDFLDHM
jgi:hypothetical protein